MKINNFPYENPEGSFSRYSTHLHYIFVFSKNYYYLCESDKF